MTLFIARYFRRNEPLGAEIRRPRRQTQVPISTTKLHSRMRHALAILAICFLASVAAGQAANLAVPSKGAIAEKVVIGTDPTQSYAAYVPTSYSEKSPTAVIYCFDPLARGKFALERFQAAAEKYGYVVVCSNNSHNGQDGPTASHMIAEFENDVRHRFNVDPARVYAAGFSGGARLAISLAVTCGKCVAGVLAAGAGFPPNIKPSNQLTFAFFGAVGVDDFNYGEMRELQVKLESLTVNYRIESFAGGHEWMDSDTVDQALAWFNLQAMNRGLIPRDEHFLERQFTARHSLAESSMSGARPIDSLYEYLGLIRDFPDRSEISEAKNMAAQIARSSEFKKALRTEDDLAQRQSRNIDDLFKSWLTSTESPSDLAVNQGAVRERIAKLQKNNDLPDDSSDRRLARRTLFGTFVGAIETGRTYVVQKKYRSAAEYYELARAIRPRDIGVVYELARIYALDGRKQQALDRLEEAVKLGFADRDRLHTEVAFASLSKEARFQRLLPDTP